jgi:hypothetical protein
MQLCGNVGDRCLDVGGVVGNQANNSNAGIDGVTILVFLYW